MSEVTTIHPKRATSAVGEAAWMVFIIVGWLVFAYLAFAVPHGLASAWIGLRSVPTYLQVILWLLLLPWTISLWIANSALAPWLRAVLILMIFVATFALSIPSLLETVRNR